jgi:hypothetical protein
MLMNHIPDSNRARITAIIARVISELAGGDPITIMRLLWPSGT